MSFIQALIIGCIYYFANSAFNASMGLYTIYRPLIGGFLVGIVMGDIKTGIEMGLKTQMIFMGFMATGGSIPSDSTLAGLVGTALAIMLKPTLGDGALDAALALAVALGMLGTFIFVGRMTWNTIFVEKASQSVKKGDIGGLFRWHVVVPQLVLAAVCIIPVTLFLLAMGDDSVLGILNNVIGVAMKPLSVVGSLLPTVGIAITLHSIGKKNTIPFFFIGFVLSEYLKLDIIGISVLGLAAAFLVYFAFDKTTENAMDDIGEL